MAITLTPFINVTANQIILESFERIGLTLPELVGNPIVSSINSLNILLTDWARYNNLYSIQPFMTNLIGGQKSYQLPIGTADIPEREVSVADITRQLGGTAYSSAGGVAQNAFDDNPATACTQTSPDGYISYAYTPAPGFALDYIGIQSNTTQQYTLAIEYSFDNSNWINIYPVINNQNPPTTGLQTYLAGQQVWYVNKVSILAPYWRIRETNGATLDIQELYFCTHNISRQISLLSRSQYLGIATKDLTGSVSSYLLNRDINPSITLWPVPDGKPDYPYLILNLKVLSPQIIYLTDILNIPNRFYEAFCANLALKLAQKDKIMGIEISPDKMANLIKSAAKSMEDIEQEDTEHAPYIFQFNL
jgi:hypothetical protein